MSTREGHEPPSQTGAGDPRLASTVGRVRAEMRERVDDLSERFDEPVRAVTDLTHRTMALFPVRVWRRFLAANGFLLSAGISYQALFAIFAAVYVLFAVAGLWLAGDQGTLEALIRLIDYYVPGLIGANGIVSESDLIAAADSSTSLFGWTGAVALAGFIWTAIGWMTYSRTAVRSIFGLPKDDRAYVLLKARDFLASVVFGAVLLVGAVLSVISTNALNWVFGLFGIDSHSWWTTLTVGATGFAIVFLIDAFVLVTMFRFLSGASIRWRRLWGGSLLGAAALVVLQVGGSYLVGGATSNPLLATFAVFVGLLLWFRLSALVTLVAAAFIYIAASDRKESLRRVTPAQLEAERLAAEQQALRIAANVEVRAARAQLAGAAWWAKPAARRRLRAAERAVDALHAADLPFPDES
ncbi:YihY/virulence factor BrkB family protein [Rathayibacter sp. YIM 133350]|uniref:YihY/virulence factor BrkB family protein n=1 Tax=Rathayibacter sp. YIM 133350 TaxID=3131992 RepID=UPI00307F957A